MLDNVYPFKSLNILCILAGCIIYAFGLKWCYEYARYFAPIRENQRPPKSLKFIEHCQVLFSRHPVEGSLKLIATAIGLAITLTADQPGTSSSSPKVAYATIYLFFAFSGLVDVLHFYFPYNVTKSLVKLALAQSFFAEGLLILHVYAILDFIGKLFLTGIAWVTALTVLLELVWPEVKLLTSCITLLHGTWLVHMIRVFETNILDIHMVFLVLTWHIAAASAVVLCVVAITRSCAPRIVIHVPPEYPIYDYSHELDQRMQCA